MPRICAFSCLAMGLLWGFGGSLHAQEGFFLQLGVGPGLAVEGSQLNSSGLTLVTKNHGIGWSFGAAGAVYLGEFGGLLRMQAGEYQYINLDTFGLGYTFILPYALSLSLAGGYGMVSFAKNWNDPFGDSGGTGYSVSINMDKSWYWGDHWKFNFGPQVFLLHAGGKDYRFINFSVNCSLAFYLKPMGLIGGYN